MRSRARLLQQRFSVLEGEDLPEMCLEIRSERERIAPTTVFGGSSYGTACKLLDTDCIISSSKKLTGCWAVIMTAVCM